MQMEKHIIIGYPQLDYFFSKADKSAGQLEKIIEKSEKMKTSQKVYNYKLLLLYNIK
jgi:hypothetical protein